MKGFFICLGIASIGGLIAMVMNFVERPDNDSGPDSLIGGRREHNFEWPPENERLSHKFRRWWEW